VWVFLAVRVVGGVCKLLLCELLGELQASMFMVLFIYLSNIVDVFFDLLCLIVVRDREASEDNNDELIVEEREPQEQGEVLLSERHC
jgi:hypothetical protein